jgi:hypothetical protein
MAALLAVAYTVMAAIRHTGDPLAGALTAIALTALYCGLAELSFRF